VALQGPLRAMPFSKNTPFCGIRRVGVPCVPHVSFHALTKAYINSKHRFIQKIIK